MVCFVATVDDESGPGMMFMPFVVMEDLLDKLKLLNYEQEFVSELRMRPLNRFVVVLSDIDHLLLLAGTILFSRPILENSFSCSRPCQPG